MKLVRRPRTIFALCMGLLSLAAIALLLHLIPIRHSGSNNLQYYDAALASKHIKSGAAGADDDSQPHPVELSLFQVLSNPERFHGKPVRLWGFLRVRFEGTGIYVTSEDANYVVNRNGLWVSFEGGSWKECGIRPERFDRRHVLIEGIFDKDDHGHLDAWSGAIHDVWRVLEEKKVFDD